jgi:single-stranded DNA-binding protein
MEAAQQFKPRTDLCSVALVGRVGNTRYSDNGKTPVIRLSVAVAEAVGKSETIREETTWVSVVVFGASATNFNNMELKGTRVAVNGRLRAGQGRQVKTIGNGDKEFELKELEVVANMRGGVQLLGGPNRNGNASTSSTEEPAGAPDEQPF